MHQRIHTNRSTPSPFGGSEENCHEPLLQERKSSCWKSHRLHSTATHHHLTCQGHMPTTRSNENSTRCASFRIFGIPYDYRRVSFSVSCVRCEAYVAGGTITLVLLVFFFPNRYPASPSTKSAYRRLHDLPCKPDQADRKTPDGTYRTLYQIAIRCSIQSWRNHCGTLKNFYW